MLRASGKLLAQPREAGIRSHGDVHRTSLDRRHAAEGVEDGSLLPGRRDDERRGCQSWQLEQSPLKRGGVGIGVATINEESERVSGRPFLWYAKERSQVFPRLVSS